MTTLAWVKNHVDLALRQKSHDDVVGCLRAVVTRLDLSPLEEQGAPDSTAARAKRPVQHTQPAKCRDCYHWAIATTARCVRGGGDQCVVRGGTQQASA